MEEISNKLKRLLVNENWDHTYLLPCFYLHKDKQYFIDLIINEMLKAMVFGHPTSEEFSKILKNYTHQILMLSTIIKSESFFEESEWRIFHFKNRRDSGKTIEFRNGKTMIIPYIEFEMCTKYQKTPLKEVIIGPSPYMDISAQSVEQLVMQKSIECKVTKSKIPFRKI